MGNTDENRSRVILNRLKPYEYKLLEKRSQTSMFQYMSEYSRHALINIPIIFTYNDKSMDDMLEELIKLRRELNYIGNNFNQAVHKLNSVMGMPDAKLWQEALTVLRDQLEPSMREIKDKLNSYSEIWSQKS